MHCFAVPANAVDFLDGLSIPLNPMGLALARSRAGTDLTALLSSLTLPLRSEYQTHMD